MDDLRHVFAELEFRAPDLWPEIEAREARLGAEAAADDMPAVRLSPGLFAVVVVLMAAALTAVGVGYGLLRLPSLPTLPAAPSAGPSADGISPSERETDLLPDFTWDAALRGEPRSGAEDVPLPPIVDPEQPSPRRLPDASEPSLADFPWVDIVALGLPASTSTGNSWNPYEYTLRRPLEDPPRPTAYGIVMDIDQDGQADLMIGMDNEPDVAGKAHREWIADLGRGEVSLNDGEGYGHGAFGTAVDTFWPLESSMGDHIFFSREGTAGKEIVRYYFWAATFVDGQVVSDYAPDRGWLSSGVICPPEPSSGPVLDVPPCTIPMPTPRP